MPSYELAISVVGHDRASGPLASVGRALERIGEIAFGITAARVLERIADGIFELGAQAVNAAAKFQIIELTLASLTARELANLTNGVKTVAEVFPQAEIKAKGLMDELSRMAILSPYQVDTIMYTYRMAAAFGYTTDEAMVFTEALTNMAAGIGADMSMMERMAYNLAQVRLQGKVTALDIRQLALAGMDLNAVLKYVSNQMGFNIKDHLDFNALIKEGKITWADFTKYFAQYADENFGGASERMARSLYGLKSTFNDVFTLTMPQILGPAIEKITDFLNQILNSFLKLRDTPLFKQIGERLGTQVEKWLTPWKKFADAIEDVVTNFANVGDMKWGGFQDGLDETTRMSNQFGGVLGIIREALTQAFGEGADILHIYDGLVSIFTVLGNIKDAIFALFKGDVKGVVGALGLEGPAADLATKVLSTIVEWVDRLKNAFVSLMDGDLDQVIDSLELDPKIQSALKVVLDGFGSLWTFIKDNGPAVLQVLGDFAGRLLGMAVPGAQEGVTGIADGFKKFADNLVENGPKIVEDLDKFLKKVTDEWIPAVGDFITKLRDEWIPNLQKVGDFIKNVVVPAVYAGIAAFVFFKSLGLIPLIVQFSKTINVLKAASTLAGGFGPLLQGFGVIAKVALAPVLSALGPIILVLAAIAGAIALVALAWTNNWGGFRDKVTEVWNAIKEVLEPAFAELKEAVGPLLEALGVLWTQLQPVLGAIAIAIGAVITVVVGLLAGVIKGIVDFVTIVVKTFTNVAKDIAVIFDGIAKFFKGIWEVIQGIFTGNGDKIKEGLSKMGQGVLQIIGGAFTAFAHIFQGAFAAVIGFVVGFVNGVINFFVNLYNRLVGHSIVTDIANGVINGFNNFINSVLTAVSTWVTNVKNFFSNIVSNVSTWVTDMMNKVRSLSLYSIGQDIVNGLWNGLRDKWAGVMSWISTAIANLSQTARNILGIDSPSTVFATIGNQVVTGLANGMRDVVNDTMRIASPSRLFDTIGKNMMAGWKQGISSNAFRPLNAMRDVTGRILDRAPTAISNTWALTINEAGDRGNIISDFTLLKSLAGA